MLGRLLAARGHTVAVDTLIDDLWAGEPPPSARKSLQAHVVRLRSALEPERPKGSPGRYVVRRGDGYALTLPADSVDSGVAAAEAAAGRAALTAGDAAAARGNATAALGLWHGEPFLDWRDEPWAQAERRRLADLRTALTETRLDADLALGRHRELLGELEALTSADPLREAWWTRLMLALYRSDRQADALAAGRRIRALLAEELGVEPGPGLRRVEQAILEQSAALDGPHHAPVQQLAAVRPREASSACPYRGLAAYGPADAVVFRGRGTAVRALVARAVTRPLVVVAGPSGAGKSSLVSAGLLPALSRGAIPGSQGWRQLVITPGGRPVDELAPLTLAGEAEPITAPVVLVVDQFEELWTAGAAQGEREAFIDTVLALQLDGLIVRVVIAVRGDHLGRLGEHPGLAEAAEDGLVLVSPLTEPEIREVVEGPAAVAGLEVDPDLVDVVVRDVHGQPGALPLLSSALVATWERRRDDTLTLAGYLEAGGVTGALARTAESVLSNLDGDGVDAARQILIRLAAEGEAGVAVRRRAALSELRLNGPGGIVRRAVVEAFVRRRLLTLDADHLEVTHEALLIAWPRLAAWLAEDAAGRAVRAHLSPEAREWDRAGRPDDRLYRGARLAAAQDWMSRPDSDATDLERDFVAASTAHSEAELAEARAQTERERTARHRTRRLARVLAVAIMVTLVSGGLAVIGQRRATANADRADEAATVADANRLAAASANAPSLDTSLLLAVEAFKIKDTPQTRDGLLATVVQHRQVSHVYPTAGVARRITLSADGRTIYVHADQQVTATDRATGGTRTLVRYSSLTQYPTDVDASPTDGSPSDGLVAVVTPPTRDAPGSSRVSLLEPDGSIRWTHDAKDLGGWPVTVAFASNGAQVIVTVIEDYQGGRPAVRYYGLDSDTGMAHRIGPRSPFDPSGIYDPWPSGISADARTLLIGDVSRMGVFDVATGATTWLDPGHDIIGSTFIPVTGGVVEGAEGGAVYWYPTRARHWSQQMADHTSQVIAAAADATGKVLVTAGYDRRVVVHRLQDGTWVTSDVLAGHEGAIREVLVSPDGKRVFSAGEDRAVLEWELTDVERFGTVIPALNDLHPTARSVETGPAVLVGTPPVWVAPIGSAPNGGSAPQMVAAFLDPATGRIKDWIPIGTRSIIPIPNAGAAVSPDGRMVAVTAQFATTILDVRDHHRVATLELDPVDGAPLGVAGPVPEPVSSVAWNQDGSRLFLAAGLGRTGGVVVVDTATWTKQQRILDGNMINVVAASPDRRMLAAGDNSGTVTLIDSSTYRVVRRLIAHGGVHSLAFSPDGSRLAAVGESKRLDVWDTRSGGPVLTPAPYTSGGGTSVQWLPDGHTIAYGGDDGHAALFDADHGLPRSVPFPVFRDSGAGLVFVAPPQGDRLALLPGARLGRVVKEGTIYPLDPADWVAHACDVVLARDLTRPEWAEYLPNRPYGPTCSDLTGRSR